MILREEPFEQSNGLGLLELRGDLDYELVLFLNGEPLIYDAYDCAGSVGRFTVLLPTTQSLAARMQIETNALQGFSEDLSLHEQVAPLLKLLPNGRYHLSLQDLESDESTTYHELVDWKHFKRDRVGWIAGYYPHYGSCESKTLVTTQPDRMLEETRTTFYANEIKSGSHPTLLVLGAKNQDTSFIIDGHHKLKAYAQCDVAPRILQIDFERIEEVAPRQAQQILKSSKDEDVRRYLRDKKRG